ncbi:cyclin-A2-1-like [Neltuma alba]|uniref:cyclin-A2-1-like n=1 Tax=Neltuma alba TaxID=207710 RepID=UPI0010A3CDEB|nr:cyclin-A2-1-like [Prosopis alba]XP_028802372.1 cyclin-A2-1-like [Prosopis alba]
MNKESTVYAEDAKFPVRITRARARALGSLGGIPPSSRPSFMQEQKRAHPTKSKRAASDENKASVVTMDGLQNKRRAVLRDVTNICENSNDKSTDASSFQAKGGKNTKSASVVSTEASSTQEDVKTKLAEELSKIRMVESRNTTNAFKLEDKMPPQRCMSNGTEDCLSAGPMLSTQDSVMSDEILTAPDKEIGKLRASDDLGIVDIDSELKDSQVWSLYAPDIYNNIRVTELERRPSTDYMEKLQQDINPNMRGILIDWLVEVSEEYRLVPDTLYLTVNLIDRFLSISLTTKQKLQLVGVACMLIASKYEEICAPRVEDFCFITDNTYTRDEVLKMESEVLNLLHFQLSVPTTKTFLRRYIQVAQCSYKLPCVELEFLANYLAELTLVEYSFLKFLPSLVAASAIFLARWTLNQSEHPWSPTLEHYTSYKTPQLKASVLALEDLQLNTKSCSLNAIREKYRLQKFKRVAALSAKSVLPLFGTQL